ncbi:uncharacterized protein LOC115226398, partial [Argonauta hians]
MIKLFVLKLLLTLLHLTTTITTSDQRFNQANYIHPGPGYVYDYLLTTTKDYITTASNLVNCARVALKNQSQFFSYNNVSKICKDFSPKNILTVKEVADKSQFAHYRRIQWIKAYAASMGKSTDIPKSFLNKGKASDWRVADNRGFFRHPILDIWQKLPIKEVKLVLYKNQKPVATIVFDGRNSTIENWFSLQKLKISPWKDLKTSNFTEFYID